MLDLALQLDILDFKVLNVIYGLRIGSLVQAVLDELNEVLVLRNQSLDVGRQLLRIGLSDNSSVVLDLLSELLIFHFQELQQLLVFSELIYHALRQHHSRLEWNL